MNCKNPHCANIIEQGGSGRKKLYCSESCKQKMKRVRAEQKRVTALRLAATRNKQQQQKLMVVPCTIDQANAYVKQQHRHHGAIPVARLAFAVADEAGLVRGVAIVGCPCNTHLDDGLTLEVRRVATDGCPNACSFLYGVAWKAVRAIGYKRLLTYTLPDEGGASLRAVGWKEIKGCGGAPWKSKKRSRKENPFFLMKKTRWEIATSDYATSRPGVFVTESPPPRVSTDSLETMPLSRKGIQLNFSKDPSEEGHPSDLTPCRSDDLSGCFL